MSARSPSGATIPLTPSPEEERRKALAAIDAGADPAAVAAAFRQRTGRDLDLGQGPTMQQAEIGLGVPERVSRFKEMNDANAAIRQGADRAAVERAFKARTGWDLREANATKKGILDAALRQKVGAGITGGLSDRIIDPVAGVIGAGLDRLRGAESPRSIRGATEDWRQTREDIADENRLPFKLGGAAGGLIGAAGVGSAAKALPLVQRLAGGGRLAQLASRAAPDAAVGATSALADGGGLDDALVGALVGAGVGPGVGWLGRIAGAGAGKGLDLGRAVPYRAANLVAKGAPKSGRFVGTLAGAKLGGGVGALAGGALGKDVGAAASRPLRALAAKLDPDWLAKSRVPGSGLANFVRNKKRAATREALKDAGGALGRLGGTSFIGGRAPEFIAESLSLDPDADRDLLTEIALSFSPGVGEAMDLRDFEIARRQGDRLGMGLAGGSLALPFVSLGPVMGAIRRGKGLDAAEVLARDNEAIGTLFDNVTDPDEALRMAVAKRHLRRTPDGYVGAPEWVKSPRHLRKMRDMVDEQVRAGMFNAPWYQRARDASAEVAGYDPATSSPFSPEALRASLFRRSGAAYSPQANPLTEVDAALQQHNARVIGGEDYAPRMGAQAENVARAYVPNPETGGFDFDPEAIRLGNKTGPYGDAGDPTVPEEGLYKTANDIWHGRVYGYTNADGSVFDRGFTPQEHAFMTAENLLAAERNKHLFEGTGMASTPRSMQAATWGAAREASYRADREEALAAYAKNLRQWEKDVAKWNRASPARRGARPTKPTMGAAGKVTDEDIRDRAMYGIDQAVAERTANITPEFVPGAATGHLSGFRDVVPAARQDQFSRDMAGVEGGRSSILEALQMYQRPIEEMRGDWTGSDGIRERNLVDVFRPLVGTRATPLLDKSGMPRMNPKGEIVTGGRELDPASIAGLETTAGLESILRAQEGVGANMFLPSTTTMTAAEKTGALASGPTEAVDALAEALEAQGLNTIMRPAGAGQSTAVVTMFDPDGRTGVEVQRGISNALRGLDQSLAESLVVRRGKTQSILEGPMTGTGDDAVSAWMGGEGSGQVTDNLNRILSRPDVHNLAQRLDASRVPQVTRERMELTDELIREYPQLQWRPDFRRLLELVTSDGGFQRLQRMIRDNGGTAAGLGLPAILAAVGVSSLNQQQQGAGLD